MEGVGLGGGGQGGCERRIEVFCENSKKKYLGGGVGGSVGGVGLGGGQGGCERRIEVFVKIQKKNCLGGGPVGGGVRWGGGGWGCRGRVGGSEWM